MPSRVRRLWLYGLLLLLPALAVGGLALGLLAREQARLAEREAAARTSQHAAIESRARLIAENIELLLSDVQAALLATLLEAPATTPRAFLAEWQATNPLVRSVFQATADGRPVWGETGAPLRAWLAAGPPWRAEPSPHLAPALPSVSTPPLPLLTPATPSPLSQSRLASAPAELTAKDVVARDAPPALENTSAPAPAPDHSSHTAQATEGAASPFNGFSQAPRTLFNAREAAEARGDTSLNVSQYNRARQEIQLVAKIKNFSDAVTNANNVPPALPGLTRNTLAPAPSVGDSMVSASPPSSTPDLLTTGSVAPTFPAAAQSILDTPAVVSVEPSPPTTLGPLLGVSASSAARAAGAASANAYAAATTDLTSSSDLAAAPSLAARAVPAAPAVAAASPAASPRADWSPWSDASGSHLFGWRELPDRSVIGLELALDAVKARLGEVFPAAPGPDEAYALLDASGRTWHSVGAAYTASTRGTRAARETFSVPVPLFGPVLPGWSVVGLDLTAPRDASSTGSFFALGASLVGLLVCAILTAGALLLRQARLSEAEAALKTSFVANVSHELKTPLTTIRLYAELLAQGRVREPGQQADYLATIGHETQRLTRLINNVLDFSRLEQGKKRYDRVPLDLAAELRALADNHRPRLAATGLTLTTELPASLAVSTDRDAVAQIVLNLLDNTCKYAATGGQALLRLEVAPARSATAPRVAEITIADRGPGVPADQRERIFEKFHRVDDRLTAEKSGAGLGLSIARQLARGLGGDLHCAAREGGGARFVLTLPISAAGKDVMILT